MKKNLIYGILFLTAAFFVGCTNALDYELKTIDNPKVILAQTFTDGSLGDFTVQNVTGEDQTWYADSRGYAYMSGYVNPTYYENEDWLISPEIDLSNLTAAYFTFDHVARFFTNPNVEATVWISEDYVDGLPSTGSWTQIKTNPFIDPGSWTFSNIGQISLTPYAGKKVRIAFKYVSTAANAGSWEVKNFLVGSGEAFNPDNGEGTLSAPYNVAGAITGSGLAAVQGYIVGYVNTAASNTPTYTSAGANVKTNVLIADEMNNVYVSNSLLLDISNAAVQSGVNLVDNPELIGKKITAYGLLGSSLGFRSLNSVSYYKLEDGTTGGVLPPDPIFRETFASGLGDFTSENVSGDEVWHWDRGYAKMTGYVNSQNRANEDWLISPQIDLAGVSSPKLIFDYVTRYFNNPTADCTIWISSDYSSGAPSAANWSKLNPTNPFFNAGNWNFVSSGVIDLSAYSGQKVKIAFKYLSTNSRAGTFEVKNFMVYK